MSAEIERRAFTRAPSCSGYATRLTLRAGRRPPHPSPNAGPTPARTTIAYPHFAPSARIAMARSLELSRVFKQFHLLVGTSNRLQFHSTSPPISRMSQ